MVEDREPGRVHAFGAEHLCVYLRHHVSQLQEVLGGVCVESAVLCERGEDRLFLSLLSLSSAMSDRNTPKDPSLEFCAKDLLGAAVDRALEDRFE